RTDTSQHRHAQRQAAGNTHPPADRPARAPPDRSLGRDPRLLPGRRDPPVRQGMGADQIGPGDRADLPAVRGRIHLHGHRAACQAGPVRSPGQFQPGGSQPLHRRGPVLQRDRHRPRREDRRSPRHPHELTPRSRPGKSRAPTVRTAAPYAVVAGQNSPLSCQALGGMLRSASGPHYHAPISPLQSGGTPLSVESTHGKAVLACMGLLIATASAAVAAPASAATQGGDSTYIVLYNDGASSAGAAATVRGAGGPLVANYSPVGGGIARSGGPDFAGAGGQKGQRAGAGPPSG